MPDTTKQTRRLLVISAVAAFIAATAPTAEASATWIPDLVFPETAPVPMAKPERAVTGSIPRDNKGPAARQIGHGTAPKATRRETQRAPVSNAKEAQR